MAKNNMYTEEYYEVDRYRAHEHETKKYVPLTPYCSTESIAEAYLDSLISDNWD